MVFQGEPGFGLPGPPGPPGLPGLPSKSFMSVCYSACCYFTEMIGDVVSGLNSSIHLRSLLKCVSEGLCPSLSPVSDWCVFIRRGQDLKTLTLMMRLSW